MSARTPAAERAAALVRERADQARYRQIIKAGERAAAADYRLPPPDLREWRAAIREMDAVNGWSAA